MTLEFIANAVNLIFIVQFSIHLSNFYHFRYFSVHISILKGTLNNLGAGVA
jgi:hypothetical protein